MNKTGKIIITALILTIGGLAITACGQRHHSPEQRSEMMMQRMVDRLDLDEAQQSKLRAIKAELEASVKAQHQQSQQLFDRLAADIESPALNKQLLMEIVESRKQAYDDIAPRIVDHVIDFHASLNPEQKKKVAEQMEQFREHFQKRHPG